LSARSPIWSRSGARGSEIGDVVVEEAAMSVGCARMRHMPHRSRLSILLLDLPPEHHAAGRDFWSRATGRPAQPDASDEKWSSLGSFADGWHVEVQRTGEGTPPRWHVDIESDDVEAEVARLEALGARRHRYVEDGRFWQLLDPAGLVFCVVGIQTGDEFDRHAVTWP
jgi:hypothetical protein